MVFLRERTELFDASILLKTSAEVNNIVRTMIELSTFKRLIGLKILQWITALLDGANLCRFLRLYYPLTYHLKYYDVYDP